MKPAHRPLACSCFALLCAVACEAPPAAAPAKLYSLFGLADAWNSRALIIPAPGLEAIFPAGIERFRLPWQDGKVVARVAFTQNKVAAYTTTDFWANYPAVWVQPMYLPVKGWNPADPKLLYVPETKPIFSVGPRSAFYSPFWQVFYVEVSGADEWAQYTSARQLFEKKLTMHAGPGRLCALAPGGTRVEEGQKLGVDLGTVGRGTGWVDGEEFAVLDYGDNRFEWNQQMEVIEQPLFVFVTPDESGAWAHAGVATVGGTGPLLARRPAISPKNRPLFGSFWRLYQVRLPPGAGVFVPEDSKYDGMRLGLRIKNTPKGMLAEYTKPTLMPAMDMATPPPTREPESLIGRVAVNGEKCFASGMYLADCVWLDSQAQLEEQIPWRIVRTEIVAACPFVSYAGMPVPP